jgi:hypothetical protein
MEGCAYKITMTISSEGDIKVVAEQGEWIYSTGQIYLSFLNWLRQRESVDNICVSLQQTKIESESE